MKRCLTCRSSFEAAEWRCPRCGWEPRTVDGIPLFAPELARQEVFFEDQYFSALAAAEDGHFWFEARNRLILWAALGNFPGMSNFLEVGCGSGFVLRAVRAAFPATLCSGTDLSPEAITIARQRCGDCRFYQLDARQLPFESQFDVIGAFDVIEHIDEDELVLSQFAEALVPGGGLIITVPQHRALWSETDEASLHRRRYSKRELVSKVERAGFEVVMTSSFVTLLLPVMWLSRRQRQGGSRAGSVLRGLQLPSRVNWLLTRIMSLEVALVRSGLRLPVGGSRLLVARRSESAEAARVSA